MKGIGMRVRELFPATLGLLVMAGSATAAPDAEQRIRAFFAATERQDVEQMVEAVSEDFRWMQIDDQQLSVEVVGREQLRSWLQGYFSSTPGLHTELLDLQIDGNYVSLIERVAWADDNGQTERQTATSVYQLDADGKIRRAWYFPAQAGGGEPEAGEQGRPTGETVSASAAP